MPTLSKRRENRADVTSFEPGILFAANLIVLFIWFSCFTEDSNAVLKCYLVRFRISKKYAYSDNLRRYGTNYISVGMPRIFTGYCKSSVF